jgi:hypothetical protein
MLKPKELDIEGLKTLIITELASIERVGIDKLLVYLTKDTDYFTAPSSASFHYAFPGGLAAHSWNVFNLLTAKIEMFNIPVQTDSISIVALLHDLCKVNFYEVDNDPPSDAQIKYLRDLAKREYYQIPPDHMTKGYVSSLINFYKNGGEKPEFKTTYKFNDQFPMGHGEKSVILAQNYIQLRDEEAIAIRWHMVAFDAGIHFNYPSGFPFRQAVEKYALVTLLATADMEASNILESEREYKE